jgi:hypothetical protein
MLWKCPTTKSIIFFSNYSLTLQLRIASNEAYMAVRIPDLIAWLS